MPVGSKREGKGETQQIDAGELNLEIIWYDLNDETAKYMLDAMTQLSGLDQEIQNILRVEAFG